MRVHFEWDRDLEEWDWSGTGAEPPSEEFWSKFEELPDLGDNLETLFAEVVRNHDCMWAGSCHSEECRPDTPQSSEAEEEPPAPAVPVSQVTGQVTTATATTLHFDHDYQKKVRTDHLGVQTPSDSEEEEEVEEEEEEEEEESSSSSSSEEEIDVVSVAPLKRNLPTNPTQRVRRRLQETVADSLLTASRAVSRRLQAKRRVGKPRFRSCGGGGGPSGETEKRSLHNNMERMRRIDLRKAFDELRLLVPTIADTQKAAKVTILKDATHYVNELGFKDKNLCLQIDALRSEQEKLRQTLSQLRRILAYKNRVK